MYELFTDSLLLDEGLKIQDGCQPCPIQSTTEMFMLHYQLFWNNSHCPKHAWINSFWLLCRSLWYINYQRIADSLIKVSKSKMTANNGRQLWLRIVCAALSHDDVIKWKHFPRYWPFVRGIHRWPVNSLHKGQWHGYLMFSLICAWINGWVNNREAGFKTPSRSLWRHCNELFWNK